MCTIMTFDTKTYLANTEAINAQIREDGVYNNDGWSLLLLGPETTLLKTLSLELVLDVLKSTPFTRFWLHARFATTKANGLAHTHGFSGGDWLVFHNGILRDVASYAFPVDSQLIAERVGTMGPVAGLDSLSHEMYLNAFVVNPNTGQWFVGRQVTNTLHSDGCANYSTNAIPAIVTQSVAPFTLSMHQEPVAEPETLETYEDYSSLDIVPDFVRDLRQDDFFDLVLDMGWERAKVPNHLYKQFTPSQRQILREIRADETPSKKYA